MPKYKVVQESTGIQEDKRVFVPGCFVWDDEPLRVVLYVVRPLEMNDCKHFIGHTNGIYREKDGWITVDLSWPLEPGHTLSLSANDLDYVLMPEIVEKGIPMHTVFNQAHITQIAVVPPETNPPYADIEYKE